MDHRLRSAVVALALLGAAPALAQGSDAPLVEEAARLVEILEAERARLAAEQEALAREAAELEAALAARPARELPATDQQIQALEAARARLAELEALRPDDALDSARRVELEGFIARSRSIQPVFYPEASFEPALSVLRTRRAAELRAGPDTGFPARGEVPGSAPVVVLAEQTGGPWRLVVFEDRAGYLRSDDLREF